MRYAARDAVQTVPQLALEAIADDRGLLIVPSHSTWTLVMDFCLDSAVTLVAFNRLWRASLIS